jgi:MFS transporter, FHS family, glucose/mannose:H+ symporter
MHGARMYDRRLVFAAACLGMLIFGVVLTSLGSLLPSLIERFDMGRADAGSLLMLMSIGILLGSVVFGPVVDRYGHKGLLLIGLGLVLVGLEGIAFAPSLLWLRLSIVLVGVGGGVINGGTNALVADISEQGRTAGLSLLGIFFGIGAVGVPFSLGMLLDRFSYQSLMVAVGLTVLVPLALTAALRFPRPKQTQGLPIREGLRLTGDRVLLLLGLMLFLQSGMEITVGGWTAAYYQERMGLDGNRALFFVSLFWFGMMLARLALGTVFRHKPGAVVLPACIGLALLGSALMMSAATLVFAGVGTFLLGAGLAAGFPVVLGRVADRYAALSGTAFSIVLVMALTGGSLLPFVTGVLGGVYGLHASLLVVPAGLALQLVIFALVLRRTRAMPATPSSAVEEHARSP